MQVVLQECFWGWQLWKRRGEASLGRKKSRCPEVPTEVLVDPPGSSEDELTFQSFPESRLGPLYPHIELAVGCGLTRKGI